MTVFDQLRSLTPADFDKAVGLFTEIMLTDIGPVATDDELRESAAFKVLDALSASKVVSLMSMAGSAEGRIAVGMLGNVEGFDNMPAGQVGDMLFGLFVGLLVGLGKEAGHE